MRCVIIEDEVNARNLLQRIIQDYCPGLVCAGEATTVPEGVDLILRTHPDVVFLDIRLRNEVSFTLLAQIKDQSFYLVVTTAYDEYAVEAFKHGAVDYILKPYVPKDVVRAVSRVQAREKSQDIFKKLNGLVAKADDHKRIPLATSDGVRFCTADDIVRIEAAAAYCYVYLMTDERVMLSKSLAEMEKCLPKHQFYRVHASHTINTAYVKSIKNEDGGYIEMMNGCTVPIARRRKQDFLNQIM